MNSVKLQRSYKVDKANLQANIKWLKRHLSAAIKSNNKGDIAFCTGALETSYAEMKQLEQDYAQLTALLNKYHLMD